MVIVLSDAYKTPTCFHLFCRQYKTSSSSSPMHMEMDSSEVYFYRFATKFFYSIFAFLSAAGVVCNLILLFTTIRSKWDPSAYSFFTLLDPSVLHAIFSSVRALCLMLCIRFKVLILPTLILVFSLEHSPRVHKSSLGRRWVVGLAA